MSGINYTDSATGLRITDEPYANGGRARAVYKGDERLWQGEPVGVGYFLKGYAAAQAEPITDLMLDPRVKDEDVLMAAKALVAEREQIEAATSAALCEVCAGTGGGSVECEACAGTGYAVEVAE